jgi:hypothetical protein
LPSIALFGFKYDMEFMRAIGEPWPGLTAAEQALAQAAKERGVTTEAWRQERRDLYLQWSSQVREAEGPAHEASVSPHSRG